MFLLRFVVCVYREYNHFVVALNCDTEVFLVLGQNLGEKRKREKLCTLVI